MIDTLWRLAWALPLVLLFGGVAALVLRRFVVPGVPANQDAQRMNVRESLSLSDDTRIHLIEVDHMAYLVLESARQTLLQSALPQASEMARVPTRSGSPWARALYKAGPR